MLAKLDRALALLTWLAAAVVVVALFAGPSLLLAKDDTPAPAATPAAGATAAPAGETATPAAGADGKAVFAANCASCHTLAAAGASGAVGPNLDQLKPDAGTVEATVTSGSGSMPSFQGRLSAEEIKAVAQFVASSAGG